MEQLLLDLINLISTGMPELVTVDEDYGQLEMINREDRSTYPLVFPAVLIECGFLSNTAEAASLNTPAYRAKLSASIFVPSAEYFVRCAAN
jgi:hypothetical protein